MRLRSASAEEILAAVQDMIAWSREGSAINVDEVTRQARLSLGGHSKYDWVGHEKRARIGVQGE